MTALVKSSALTEHANAIRKLGKQTVENVIEIGRHLTEAKLVVRKLGGSWGDWLKAEFGWKEISARSFMNVCEWSKSGSSKFELADLPISSLYLLAEPSTSEKARDEIAGRVKRGEKVKHKEVAKAVRKHKSHGPKQPNGLPARILDVIKSAPKGLITEEIKQHLSDVHPQTVNSQTNALAQKGWLRDSGERRHGTSKGGRPAIVYVYEPNPQPRTKTKAASKSNNVAVFSDHKLVAMIEDETICRVIEQWSKGKTREQRDTKAYHLCIPLVGNSLGGISRVVDVQEKEAMREGRAFTLKL
jgi:hypothetical protein